MQSFIPGLELCGRFYAGLVRPLLERDFPRLEYAAALVGYGSEVLGFDTPMSMDHAWSPRLLLFLPEAQESLAADIDALLTRELPTHFLGFPLSTLAVPNEPGVFKMDENALPGQIHHRVRILTLRDFVSQELDWDYHQEPDAIDWLTFPSQKLRELTAGQVYHDGTGELTALRNRLAFYPPQVWLFLLASGWARLAEEEHLMPRAGFVGDELGSGLIGSRLARDIMSLCFLIERQYAPYPKWFGSAFQRLSCSSAFSPLLWQAQTAPTWREREAALCGAYTLLAQAQNRLALVEPIDATIRSFHGRPFQVLDAGRFADALRAALVDPQLVRISERGLIGGVDQFSDNTLLRSHPTWRSGVRALYTA